MTKEIGKVFVDDVKINRFKLEEECEQHAQVYWYYAELLAKARSNRDAIENALKLKKAEVNMAIRTTPEVYVGNVKVTESVVESTVEINADVQKYKTELLAAESEVYTLEAAVTAMTHRKSELDNLVQLWIKAYYASPDGGKPSQTGDAQAAVRAAMNNK